MDEALESTSSSSSSSRRLTLSQIVERLLTKDEPARSTVTLSRNASGETQIEVAVKVGDDDETPNAEAAAARARAIYDELREAYPSTKEHEPAEVSLTRNARGETQIAVTVKTAALSETSTLDGVRDAASEAFRTLRGRFPLSTGPREGMVAAAADGAE